MGQTTSRPEEPSTRWNWRRSVTGSSIRNSDHHAQDNELLRHFRLSRAPSEAAVERLSQVLGNGRGEVGASDRPTDGGRPGIIQRTQSTFRGMVHRNPSQRHRRSLFLPRQTFHHAEGVSNPAIHHTNEMEPDAEQSLSRLPTIDVTSSWEHEAFADPEMVQHSPPEASHSPRRPHLRLSALRPDRSLRHLASSLRRRYSSHHTAFLRPSSEHGDSAAALSRLLSAAAAATAATLIGDTQQALTEVRSLAGATNNHNIGMDGDPSFEDFLRALQNGRIASAMRQSSEGEEASRENSLNFIRMFQFDAITVDLNNLNPNLRRTTVLHESSPGANLARLVPIIIVGIRAMAPDSTAPTDADDLPPFVDALANLQRSLPETFEGHDYETIDSILRPPQNSTSFRHRRRASMGAFGLSRNRINDRLDNQRHHRATDRILERPVSMSSAASSPEPHSPPATPASPSPVLSRIGSPNRSRATSFSANSVRDLQAEARFNNMIRRPSLITPGTPLREENAPLSSTEAGDFLLTSPSNPTPTRLSALRRSDTVPNIHYPRFASGHPRRNGVVEPDNLPVMANAGNNDSGDDSDDTEDETDVDSPRPLGDTRNWIIYVLGGSYPEDHPILTTPSLFTDNPTYEDMMLLSAILGPAKAPVASDEDVQSAGGVYEIVSEPSCMEPSQQGNIGDTLKTMRLVAVATQGDDPIHLELEQRCLVCLGEFEVTERVRQLKECKHIFHKECIDQWLTQGRNSCPLCRSLGVTEKDRNTESTSPSEQSAPLRNLPV